MTVFSYNGQNLSFSSCVIENPKERTDLREKNKSRPNLNFDEEEKDDEINNKISEDLEQKLNCTFL